ncbi:MAG: hypothetical protein AB4426_15245 [Xenococcaceae cyanobacterium]
MAKKKRFRDIWVNQTTLGRQFNMSAIAMGKKLKELGLREPDGKPTQRAIDEEFCRSTPLKDGKSFYMWHKTKVTELLKQSDSQGLSPQEIRCRELAENLIQADKVYQNAKSGMEEKGAILWLEQIESEIREADKPLVNNFLKELGSKLQLD